MSSHREVITQDIIEVLTDMSAPRPVLITREPFDVDKLALTQFPAQQAMRKEKITLWADLEEAFYKLRFAAL